MYTLSSKRFVIFLLAFSILAGLFLYRYAGTVSFWLDELATVSSVRNDLSFSDTVNIYATRDNQSPLMPFITYFWYRAVPHTERDLRLLGIILTVIACCVVGITGKKLYGPRFGVFAFMLMICNYTVLSGAALELRPYNTLLLVCAVNYYCYLMRLRHENWFTVLLYGLSMGLLPYTHYISVLFCFGLFLADCFMIVKGRAGFKVILAYILGALIFCPWAYVLFTHFDLSLFTESWRPVPNLRSIIDLGKYLTGAGCFLSILFMSAVLGLLRVMMDAFSKREEPSAETAFMSAGIFASAFMVLAVFVYSTFLRPQGSFFLNRYFFPTVPFVALTSAYGANFMYESMSAVFAHRTKLLFAAMFLMIAVIGLGKAAKDKGNNEPYREAINSIRTHEAEYSGGKSAVVTTEGSYTYEGWREIYLASYDEFTVYPIGNEGVLSELKAHMYDRIYFMFLHASPAKLKKGTDVLKWLRENYYFGEQDEECSLQVLELRR